MPRRVNNDGRFGTVVAPGDRRTRPGTVWVEWLNGASSAVPVTALTPVCEGSFRAAVSAFVLHAQRFRGL